MDSDLQQLVDSERLSLHLAEKLDQLVPGKCCFHRSWGTGRITERDAVTGRILLDFPNKPGHGMEFEYAATSLVLLADDHIESRKLNDLAAVKAEAESDPVALMTCVVKSLAPQAMADRVEAALCPSVVSKDNWKKWWDGAKRAIKKTGLFTVPSKRSEPIQLHEAPPDHGGEALEAIKASIGPKAKLAALEKFLKHSKNVDDASLAKELVADIDETLGKVPASQISWGVELALVRDELVETANITSEIAPDATIKLLPREHRALVNLIASLTASKQGACINRAKGVYGDNWHSFGIEVLPLVNGRVADVIIDSFKKEGRGAEIISAIERLIRERNLNYDFLIWICKSKDQEIRQLFGVQLLYAILSVLELDQLEGSKRSGRLQDLLVSRKDLMSDMLKSASDEEVRDVTRAIMLSPIFDELDKRSVLASLVKLYPFVQQMIIGAEGRAKEKEKEKEKDGKDKDSEALTFIVSWPSLEKRKSELQDIIQNKIPQNTKDIAVARSYGDLRENSEFKAAKEMQTVLMRRRAELESMLLRAQGTDFANVDTDMVNIGTIVELTDVENNSSLSYTILGAWDSDPAQGVVSYQTPIAQALQHKKVGDTLSLTMQSGEVHKVRVDKISPYKK